jgi:hypothetical protein
VIVVCLQRRKRGGKRKGWVVGEGEGGGSGAESAWKRETGGEGGGASAAFGGHHRRVADGCGQTARARAVPSWGGGVADPWARGHSNGWRGLHCFKFK